MKNLLLSTALLAAMAMPALAASDGPIGVSVAMADNGIHPGIWDMSPNVVFIGTSAPWDAGAIKLHNQTPVAVKLKSVTVDFDDMEINVWSAALPVIIPPGGQVILTQTALPSNFDTTKLKGPAVIHVKEKIGTASSVTYSFLDKFKVLGMADGSTQWTKLESVSDSGH